MPAPKRGPDRETVAAAIRDAGGNLSRAAGILGCSRQTLYVWIYRHGLERLAGVNLERRAEVEKRELRIVPPRPTVEAPVKVTVTLPGALWKAARIAAIEGDCTVSQFVQSALEAAIAAEARS